MCGIVGIYYYDSARQVDEATLRKMARTLSHRGPDGEGFWSGGRCALGHRRLSIIDLAGGQQPLSNDLGKVGVVNGEIYNHVELRRQLEAQGHHFRSTSDSEAVLHSWQEWGQSAVLKLDGMFAFAMMDTDTHTLTLCRDRLGIKPLYWTECDGALLFASEIKALLAYPAVRARLNQAAVQSYLEFRYVVGEETFFDGIYSLSPGHQMVVTPAGHSVSKYWEIPRESERAPISDSDALAETRWLLEQSVGERMMSDVPLGGYLSGGVDSSVLVALMSARSDSPINTYCSGFAEQGYNEFAYAKQVAEMHQTRHHEVLLSAEEYFEYLPQLIRYKDGPLGIPNEVPLWQMSRRLKQDISVVLSGEGADELFAGYGRIFRSAEMHSRGAMQNTLSPFELFMGQYSYFGKEWLPRLMSPEFLTLQSERPYANDVFESAFSSVAHLSTFDQFLWVFQRHHLPGLLQRLDTTTMAASVEGRVPFVCHHLVEFGHRLPASLKLRWKSSQAAARARNKSIEESSEVDDTPKWLLRELARDFIPSEIITRKKVGFPVPLGAWLGGELASQAQELLLSKDARISPLINRTGVASIVNRLGESTWAEGMRVWMLLNLEIFLREYGL